ncbi:MAG TPA: glycosyltransferase family 1 protein, partial [Tepidiformaceae bacterium]|nr:glycosyltransferase family 1 protein [Tepidiformaceae bacterium]
MRVLLVHPRSDPRWPSMDRYARGLSEAASALTVRSTAAGYLDPPRPVRRLVRRYGDTSPIGAAVAGFDPEVVHVTSEALAHHVPRRRGAGWVATCHDLIYLHPEAGHWTSGMRARVQLEARRHSMRGLSRADIVVAVSRATANLILKHGFADEERVRVVYPVVDARFQESPPPDVGLPAGPKILSVGMAYRYKNLPALIRALSRPGLRGATVVRIGARLPADLRALARECGVDDRIVELGTVSDAQLSAVYASCDVLAQPSLDEGFGYPVAEAMAMGLPVVCSDGGALPEVVADAGRVVPLGGDPLDMARRFGDALESVLSDARLRDEMAAAGRLRARAFTAGAVAPNLIAAYVEAAG